MTHRGDQVANVFRRRRAVPSRDLVDRERAERWIAIHNAKGMLSKDELGSSAYDAAVSGGLFKPQRPDQQANAFITRLTSPIDHWHYVEEPDA